MPDTQILIDKCMNILTIDAGTTNTRASLWRMGQVIGRSSVPVGVRDTAISGSRTALQEAVRNSINAALTQAGLMPYEVDRVIGSGMITSSLGLHELPHITAPAGVDELAQGIACVRIPAVFEQPIWFVPGVRNVAASENITLANAEAMDMMRGEEVEVMGLIARLGLRGPALLVLPGSHSKFIVIDSDNRISGCATTIAGELLSVITHETSLKSVLEAGFATGINPDMLLAGAASVRRVGLARTCCSVHVLAQFNVCSREDRANFVLGAVLGMDLIALKNTQALHIQPGIPVIVAGNSILREAMRLLVQEDTFFTGSVTAISESQQADLAGCGAIEVAAARNFEQSTYSNIGDE